MTISFFAGTYSNLSNHPRMLRLRDSRGPQPAQIKIDPKTGFPTVNGETVFDGRPSAKKDGDTIMEEDEPEEDEEEEEEYGAFRVLARSYRSR